jgi:hypothetical protein
MSATLKQNLSCPQCTKIFRDPIVLPCGHTLCKEHLRACTTIDCLPCKREFINLNENSFVTNIVVANLVKDENFLSQDEHDCKQTIIELFSSFEQCLDELSQTQSGFELEFFEHFQEIRRCIDIHRENAHFQRFKSKIDEISLSMIDRTHVFEKRYFASLNNVLKQQIQPIQIGSIDVEEETKKLNEFLRQSNITLDSIKAIHDKQAVNVSDLKLKLDEIAALKDHLKSNQFVPSLTFKGENDFGVLILNEYKCNLSKSVILSQRQSFELLNLCQFSPDIEWTLLYRASQDGFEAKHFHSKCDSHCRTLTIFKSAEPHSFIFGGYTECTWGATRKSSETKDTNAFIFSLTNRDGQPCRIKVSKEWSSMSIDCHAACGPSFGIGDIYICDRANENGNSYSDLGYAYKHPRYAHKSRAAREFLAGAHKFQLSEIEVYQRVEI